jgi:hypothetical protein
MLDPLAESVAICNERGASAQGAPVTGKDVPAILRALYEQLERVTREANAAKMTIGNMAVQSALLRQG